MSGHQHTCALDDDGVKCWGEVDSVNDKGQTKVPTTLRRPRQVGAGHRHSCALDDDGVTCWGDNTSKQTMVPTNLHRPRQLAVGSYTNCVLDDDGVKCWGFDDHGKIVVPPLRNPTGVFAGGLHLCAVDDDGLKCWGRSESGQTNVPSTVRHPSKVALGAQHTCAIENGTVTCWGQNHWGQTEAPPLREPREISAGLQHTCALDDDGIHCWGDNKSGQLDAPADFATTGRHVCLASDTGARCAGDNERGQLGVESDLDSVVALTVASVTQLGPSFGVPARVATGGAFGCALAGSGIVKCWGTNERGQLGLGDTRDRGIASGEMGDALAALGFGGTSIEELAVGAAHACARGHHGEMFCWGDGADGQLGTEAAADATRPTTPLTKPGVAIRALALGRAHTCVLTGGGEVYCFGRNDRGQLGLGRPGAVGDRPGTMGSAMDPVDLGAGFSVKTIASGDDHACALSTEGNVKCWGANDRGQLGLGDTRDRGLRHEELGATLPPADLGRGQFAVDLACGARHCCVRTVQNTMKCWGANADGQLGLGDDTPRGTDSKSMGDSLPFVPTPPRERVLSMLVVSDRSCARTDSGLRCWGRNRSGELGYGDRDVRGSTPATVPRELQPLGL